MNPDQGLLHLAEFDADYADLLPADRAAKILDIGCGMGHFLRYLRARGYGSSAGVDASADQVAYCRSNGLESVELVDDLFVYLGAHPGAFALVTLNDVLEHFTKNEIIELLVVTKKALRPGGRIVVRTPNISCAYGPYGRYIDFTHEVGFSETSLRQVLVAVGFADVVIRGNRVPVSWRPRRLLWLLARLLWSKVLGIIYLIEAGTDRPRIYEKVLVGSATNAGAEPDG